MNSEKLALATQIVRTAGISALGYFNKLSTIKIEEKKTLDFVSEADVSVEQQLISDLKKAFPNDGFIGEEGFHAKGKSHYANIIEQDNYDGYWVIDPIDGTTNFINHLNYWCISVAYYDCKEKKATMGIIYQPCLDKMFSGALSLGVSLNNTALPLLPTSHSDIAQKHSIMGMGFGTTDPVEIELKLITFVKGMSVGYRKLSCCALMLTEVAVGSYRGYFEPHINSWDCLAGLVMIEELGGKVCDFLANDGLLSGNVLLAATHEFYPRIEPLIALSRK